MEKLLHMKELMSSLNLNAFIAAKIITSLKTASRSRLAPTAARKDMHPTDATSKTKRQRTTTTKAKKKSTL